MIFKKRASFLFVISLFFNTHFLAATTYAQAGVTMQAGDDLVDRIAPMARSTARVGTDAKIGDFGGFLDLARLKYKDPILVSTTDGVGTKLKIAHQMNKHDTVGIDLVAMNVNDLIVHGAEPLFFLDYFATSALDVEQASDLIKGNFFRVDGNGNSLFMFLVMLSGC